MLEAKIIEVVLSEYFQAGINWAAFANGDNHRLSSGVISPGTLLQNSGRLATGVTGVLWSAFRLGVAYTGRSATT